VSTVGSRFGRLARIKLTKLTWIATHSLPVHEDNGAGVLILCRCGHAAIHGQMRQERTNLVRPEFLRVPLVVEQDESPCPGHIGLLGPVRKVFQAVSICC